MQRLMVALDVPSKREAMALYRRLKPVALGMKVGLELVHAAGLDILHELAAEGADLFYDAKLHDIPNTVAAAMRQIVDIGVTMVNVHATGGLEMMRAAGEAAAEEAARRGKPRPKVLAVTVLTSLDGPALDEIGIAGEPEAAVRRLAQLARRAGLDGVVCSGAEIEMIRRECGADFLTVVPGVRRAQDAAGDQRRTLDPSSAIRLGASVLVVGRPILTAADPVAAAAEFQNLIREG